MIDPREAPWYWDEFDAALRPRVGALAVIAAGLLALCTAPGIARTTPAAPAPQPAIGALPPCHQPINNASPTQPHQKETR